MDLWNDRIGTLDKCCTKLVGVTFLSGGGSCLMYFGQIASLLESVWGARRSLGAHPTLPLDVTEATWLVELPDRVLTDDELIGYRARALAKHKTHIDEMRARVSEVKIKRLLKYEKDHKAVIKDYK